MGHAHAGLFINKYVSKLVYTLLRNKLFSTKYFVLLTKIN